MSKSTETDLSSEIPSDRVPPGQHRIEGTARIPGLGLRLRFSVKSPDRSPAAVAAGWTVCAACGLASPAITALAAGLERLPSWSLLAAASGDALLVAAAAAFCLWYQRGRGHDLTVLEGDPTDRADAMPDLQQTHDITLGTGQKSMADIAATSSPWSVTGLGLAFLTLAIAGILHAAAFIALAALIPGSAATAVVSACAVFLVTTVGGAVTMIRVEQLDRPPDPGRPPTRPLPGALLAGSVPRLRLNCINDEPVRPRTRLFLLSWSALLVNLELDPPWAPLDGSIRAQ